MGALLEDDRMNWLCCGCDDDDNDNIHRHKLFVCTWHHDSLLLINNGCFSRIFRSTWYFLCPLNHHVYLCMYVCMSLYAFIRCDTCTLVYLLSFDDRRPSSKLRGCRYVCRLPGSTRWGSSGHHLSLPDFYYVAIL